MKPLRVSIAIFALLPACAGTSAQSGASAAPTPAAMVPASAATGVASPNMAASPASRSSAQVAPDVPAGAAAVRDAELARQAAAIFGVFVNNDMAFSRDGKRLVFVSDRD